ncbi:TPA: hypothetical protein N0F65_000405 [Lagenidium giganteum]|uniref:Protein FAN n=1 Tax=Lagenidium giganteum TaxID=4803 RepID=A0AAV2Z250_9STRA|nr:TPA: hypothetical protein N0F65_000405 [Lagenidium giganteum]
MIVDREKKTPSDFLKSVLGRPVEVKLNNGVEYKGILACLDGFMNIAMEQTQEYVNGQLKAHYGDCFIRGNNECLHHQHVDTPIATSGCTRTFLLSSIMLGSRGTTKGAQTRFNLLLLEDGEFFLDVRCVSDDYDAMRRLRWTDMAVLQDFSVFRYLEPVPSSHRKVQGRLKVCTRGFFFEPQDINLPILRFPFREMAEMPVAELFEQPTGQDCTVFLTFAIKSVVEMKERGVDHPYVTRDTKDPAQTVPTKFIFALLHSKIEDFLRNVQPIWELAHEKNVLNKVDEEMLLAPVLKPRLTDQFDSSLLVDFRERPLLSAGKLVDRIVPLLKYPGCLMLTNQRLYFQPAQVNNVGDPVLNWAYDTVQYLYKRRHMLKQTGLEVCLNNGESFFFSFRSRKDRDEIYDMMVKQPDLQRFQQTDLESMILKWQRKEVSNFDYLMYLNNTAGRTSNDLTQYPVFPWIIKDYESSKLDLSSRSIYRDLSKPVGALNEERLEHFKIRFENMPRGMEAEGLPPPFLYGTHYPTPGYVLFYLVRMAPEYMLCLQNGKFDSPDRLFKSIESTWKSCLANPADLKELIPAFYDESLVADEWLNNTKNLDLGTTQQLSRVGDVELPPWALSPSDFIRKNREALESDYVSEHLHHWIDLIFGYKQKGEEAVKANNLFYYLSYEGSVDLETITDPVEKCSFEAQIQEFGQTPKQLFASPHPARSEIGKAIELASEELPSPRKRNSSASSASSEHRDSSREPSGARDSSGFEDDAAGDGNNGARRSMFAFRGRTIGVPGVPKKAKNLVGGIAAQLRRRVSTESSKKWQWGFTTDMAYADSPYWAGSSPHMLHSGEVTSIVLARDGRAMFTTSKDTTFKVSAAIDGSLRRNLACNLALSCCDVSSDEKHVFIGSWDNCLYMYSVECGRVIDQVTAHDDGLSAVRVVDDRIVTTSWDGSLKVWHYASSGITVAPLSTFMECEESIVGLDVSDDGSCAVAATQNGVLHMIDLRTNELVRKMNSSTEHSAEVSGVTFCGTSSTIVSVTVENEISVFNSEGKRQASLNLQVDGQIRCFASDGDFAVGGTSTGKLLTWKLDEPPAKALVYEIANAHAQAVCAVAVSGNGSLMVSGAADGSVRVWKLKRKSSRGRLAKLF